MGEPLLSPHWPRVASLHPRLTGSVTITAQQVRHERWYVIADRVSGRQLRVNALGHELVGRLDGRLTLQQIWDALVWRLGEDTLSQHEVLHIVSSLAEAGMLISDIAKQEGREPVEIGLELLSDPKASGVNFGMDEADVRYAMMMPWVATASDGSAKIDDGTRPILEDAVCQITWDAVIHSVEDIEALPWPPRTVNVKPSRFGSIQRLFDAYDYCEARGIGAYGGGQFELGVGRGHIQYLAALFHPDTPNDVAPGAFNLPEPASGLPTSPLVIVPRETGFLAL